MTHTGIGGLLDTTRVKRLEGLPPATDLVNRKFKREAVNELWVTDITEHPARKGKVFCAAVFDVCSLKIFDWAIHSKRDSTPVVHAPD